MTDTIDDVLRDRTAVLTGASGGIGRALGLRLAESGVDLLLTYGEHPDETGELARRIRGLGGRAEIVQHLVPAVGAGAAGGQQLQAQGAGIEPVGDAGVRAQRQPSGCRTGRVTNISGYMALGWKLVIDSTDAPALADFWAAALGYEVEDPSTLIERLLAAGHIGEEAVAEHRGRRIFRGYAAIRHPEDPFDETSGIGHGRRLLFQDVPEGKVGKNRLHLDVHSEPGGLDELVARLEGLGARRVREVDKGPAGHWWVMQDPEGNEFCVA